MENNETYFKILLDKIIEQNNEINRLKFEIEQLKIKPSELKTKGKNDLVNDTIEVFKSCDKIGIKNETKYRR